MINAKNIAVIIAKMNNCLNYKHI